MADEHNPQLARAAESAVPVPFAEKAMASLLQLHSELMEEKERRVDLYRRLMDKEQTLAELRMYVKLLEDRLQAKAPAKEAQSEPVEPERVSEREPLQAAPPPAPRPPEQRPAAPRPPPIPKSAARVQARPVKVPKQNPIAAPERVNTVRDTRLDGWKSW